MSDEAKSTTTPASQTDDASMHPASKKPGAASEKNPEKGKTAPAASSGPKPAARRADKSGKAPKAKGADKGGRGARAKTSASSVFFWIVVVVIFVAAGAYVTRSVWMPSVTPMWGGGPSGQHVSPEKAPSQIDLRLNDLSTGLSAAQGRIAALEKRLDAEGEMAATVSKTTQALGALSARLDVLEARIAENGGAAGAALQAQTGALADTLAALRNDMQDVQHRVGALEGTVAAKSTAATSSEALVLATSQLFDATRSDTSFGASLEALRAVAGDDPQVARVIQILSPHAAVGIPNLEALRARFEAMAGDVVRAKIAPGGDGIWSRIKVGLARLITVRRTDANGGGDPVDGALAVAQSALDKGDLTVAVRALERLKGAPADAAAAWLGDANARLQVDQAISQLRTLALTRLKSVGGR